MSNPSDLFINPPETLNTSFYNMKALRSNFYIGSKVARDFAHTDDVSRFFSCLLKKTLLDIHKIGSELNFLMHARERGQNIRGLGKGSENHNWRRFIGRGGTVLIVCFNVCLKICSLHK